MGIRVAVEHVTSYRYDRPICLGAQVVRLRPAPHCRTQIESYSLRIAPQDHFINWQQDPFGNHLARLVFTKSTREFEVAVDVVADLEAINPFDFFLEPTAEKFPFVYDEGLACELAPYLELQTHGKLFAKYLEGIDRRPRPLMDFLVAFNQQIQAHLGYTIRLAEGLQTPEETLQQRKGACRDFAWLATMLLRHLGIAARFVSGYSIQLRPDVKPIEGPAGVSEDVVDLHAWTEAYLPGAGWVGMDPTSGLLTGEGHIPLACTPNPSSAAPIAGSIDECEATFEHTMRIVRLREDPRNTRPYSEDLWDEILRRGQQVQERLEARDVRLTMGGEPTFVSIDDFAGQEWTTHALGETKRRRSEELIKRLRRRFAPGGALHYGQGKWYPGESLPRWALACYWRADGEPVWHDERWLADPMVPPAKASGVEEAEALCRALATRLGVNEKFVCPAFEDIGYYLWKEDRLPINVDPADAKLEREEDRLRLAKVFARGLATPAGFVLPVEADTTEEGVVVFRSGAWPFRSGHLFLHPGDSPIGLRLPLDALPWAKDDDVRRPEPVDPTQSRPALLHRERLQARDAPPSSPARAPSRGVSAPGIVRTALCVEERGGRVHIFLPPVTGVEQYLALLGAIEDTATLLGQPVIIEGYTPPDDPRLRCLKVTPDPGVIEVNVHPTRTWDELCDLTLGLYEDARQSRLGPEKYLVDGRVVGTGGGNHIVLGGPTALDSPFLRRPDLLRNLIAYWNNHPSLSYLFSSLFIGPTSQAPRLDEGRPESLHELEIAFTKTPSGGQCPPWLVDRLFRDLLADATGNTHRTELCIDKLYSPDSVSGRLGLVEVRSFEMPPHPRMSLAQQLLLRALVAWLWDEPYCAPLERFGTKLQDRFMLPHFVVQDFGEVLDDLGRGGLPFDPAWFLPHVEFRFPRIGTVTYAGVEVELRTALEPWHVLGEDPSAGGTVRNVDSSLERIQVKIRGAIDGRHIVACNRIGVPLHPTGIAGEFVAGVRFRAWQPPRCLHPTIPVHTPLVFDVYDTWTQRAVGGCTYHVAHPGGRHHEAPPVNPLEAEGRRKARFEAAGHTPGPFDLLVAPTTRELPMTLDLRRVER